MTFKSGLTHIFIDYPSYVNNEIDIASALESKSGPVTTLASALTIKSPFGGEKSAFNNMTSSDPYPYLTHYLVE